MFEKLVKCQVVPPERMSNAIFKGKIDPQKPPLKTRRLAAKKLANADKSDEQNEKRLKKQAKKLTQIQSKLSQFGIQLDLPEEGNVKTPKSAQKSGKKSVATTPVMEIDDSDEDIKLKTPPHVKKVKSRPNSAAATPKGSRSNTPIKPNLAKLERMLSKKMTESPLAKSVKTPNSGKKLKKLK